MQVAPCNRAITVTPHSPWRTLGCVWPSACCLLGHHPWHCGHQQAVPLLRGSGFSRSSCSFQGACWGISEVRRGEEAMWLCRRGLGVEPGGRCERQEHGTGDTGHRTQDAGQGTRDTGHRTQAEDTSVRAALGRSPTRHLELNVPSAGALPGLHVHRAGTGVRHLPFPPPPPLLPKAFAVSPPANHLTPLFPPSSSHNGGGWRWWVVRREGRASECTIPATGMPRPACCPLPLV